MDTIHDNQKDLKKRNFSKPDTSGTHPDRYASYNTVEEVKKMCGSNQNQPCPSLIPGLDANVGTLERILMVAAGGYLLYNALSGTNKNVPQTIAGTAMLARGITGYCPAYHALKKTQLPESSNINIRTSISIDKPVDEVYAFWRKLDNLPKFMSHLKSVHEKNDSHSHWIAQGPAGIGKISWDAKILMEEPGRILSWQSLPHSTIDNAGKVVFKQRGSAGTELDITISYHAPFGTTGETAGKLLNPLFERMVKSDIENLKTYLETGLNPEA